MPIEVLHPLFALSARQLEGFMHLQDQPCQRASSTCSVTWLLSVAIG